MPERSLEISYRGGKAFAGYFYLGVSKKRDYSRSERAEAGLVVDFDSDEKPIGIEITAPELVTIEIMNRVLDSLGQDPVDVSEISPLRAA